MGFKVKTQTNFFDLALKDSLDKNNSYKMLQELNKIISWSKSERILEKKYAAGQGLGPNAYHPLLLFKCLLLQKWFRIDSDPELESQINDRISFKKFLGLSIDDSSPDHSTFSRFRNRLSLDTMNLLNNEILNQFHQKGLAINEGVAVDARLVKSASKPISNKKIKELNDNAHKPKLDKNGNKVKFQRDIESDWVIKNDKPHYGLKEHAAVDVDNGFILSTTLSKASIHESNYLPYCTATSKHTDQKIEKVYADKGYFGKPNSKFLSMNKIQDGIMRKGTKNAKLTQNEKERNKKLSKKRYIVEQYFGLSHINDNAYKARFTTIAKNIFDALFRQAAFNIKRGLKLLPVT